MSESEYKDDNIKLHHYLTYGRDKSFLGGLFLQTAPILFALVPGSIPVYQYPIRDNLATGIFGIVAFLLLLSVYQTTGWLANGIYSVEFRKQKTRVLSTLAYVLVGITATVIGYLLFISPVSNPEFGAPDASLGMVYSLIYAQILALVLWKSIESGEDPDEISENINRFLQITGSIEGPTSQVEEGMIDDIEQLSRHLAEQFNDEPASGTHGLGDRLSDWADSFENESNIHGWVERIECDEFSTISDDLYNMV